MRPKNRTTSFCFLRLFEVFFLAYDAYAKRDKKKKKKKRNEAYSESINSAPPLLIRLPVTRVEATLARCNYNHDENPVCKTYFHPKPFVCSTSVINLRIFFLLNVNCKPIRVLLWDTRGFQTIRRTVRTVFQGIPMSNHHWVSF